MHHPVQNDGNFCLLDLEDIELSDPLMRIETYLCSHQSEGNYCETSAGTGAKDLCDSNRLSDHSNRIFRPEFYIEEKDSGKIRVRDLDVKSNSYRHILYAHIEPIDMETY